MKKSCILLLSCLFLAGSVMFAGTIEKTYTFGNYSVKTTGTYSMITFDNTLLTGIAGEPMLPWQSVSLLLPPGESATSITIIPENENEIPGTFMLSPKQPVQPTSATKPAGFIRSEKIYGSAEDYPASLAGHLITQYLNGYSFALSTFTPVRYVPATGKVSYYQKVTVRIQTGKDEKSAGTLKNLTSSSGALQRVKNFAQNPELMSKYPAKETKLNGYKILIITPSYHRAGFTDLVHYYDSIGLETRIATTDSILGNGAGIDDPDKIRNAIIHEYQNNGIEYVLLGGGAMVVPFRGFYCYVESGSGYEDSGIPADLYFSGLDGNFDANGNQIYAEVTDDPDLLPDIAVGRFVFSDNQGLAAMVHKSISYQRNPVTGEMKHPLLIGEFLYDTPPTWGGDYMNLLINDHSDNGYFTHGIPESTNTIEKLYDTEFYNWTASTLMEKLNQGRSFIHHLGHANTDYMMRMVTGDITNENFANVNGVTHNYELLYTQGCYDGAFDQYGCIAVQCVSIENFLVAGIFNSRYGWFDQGTTEGPSQHLQREFVSALYTDTLPEHHIGATHMISKIRTAPWVTAPGEFEPGAQRWCHYDCNLFGDPALNIWTDEPIVGMAEKNLSSGGMIIYPNPATNRISVDCVLPASSDVHIRILNVYGQEAMQPLNLASQSRGQHTWSLNLPDLPAGIYFVSAEAGSSTKSGKFLIQK